MCSVAVQAGSGNGGREERDGESHTEDGGQEDKDLREKKGDDRDKPTISPETDGGRCVDEDRDKNSLSATSDSGGGRTDFGSDVSSSYVVPVSIAMTTASTSPLSRDLVTRDTEVATPSEPDRPTFSVCVPAMDWRVQPFGQVLGMKALPITGILPAPVERDAAVQPKRRVRMKLSATLESPS